MKRLLLATALVVASVLPSSPDPMVPTGGGSGSTPVAPSYACGTLIAGQLLVCTPQGVLP